MADGESLAREACLSWPEGEPHQLRAAGRRFDAAADATTALAGRLAGIQAGDAGWSGFAAARFDASITAESAALRTAGSGFGRASSALRDLARVVDDAQREVVRWAKQVLEAEERAEQAASAAAGAVSSGAGEDVIARTAAAAAQLGDDLADLRARAQAAAQAECDRVRAADGRCASVIEGVAARAPLRQVVPGSPPATPLAFAVARAHAPHYRFDGDEDHFPMDPRTWLANADLKYRPDGTPYFDPRGEDVRNGDLENAVLPFAYHVTPDGDLQLEYGAYYPFNDFPSAPTTAVDHEGDFEPVTVQFEPRTGRPVAVDYEAHGHTGAVPWRDVERDGGRPVVYPSHGGHGNNPQRGNYENDFSSGEAGGDVIHFLVDEDAYRDNADGHGPRWDPADDLLDARSVPQLRGDARFGEDTGRNPRSFLHPEQGPPPDLEDAPGHAPAEP